MDSLSSLDDLSPDYVDYNQGPVAGRVGAAMMGVSVALVMLRLAARLVRTTRLGLDDWILVGGLVDARPDFRYWDTNRTDIPPPALRRCVYGNYHRPWVPLLFRHLCARGCQLTRIRFQWPTTA